MKYWKIGCKVNSKFISIKFGKNTLIKNGEILDLNINKVNSYLKNRNMNLYVKVGKKKIHLLFGLVILQINTFELMQIIGAKITKVVACILKKKKKILISSRPDEKEFSGFFEFPGKVKKADYVTTALKRELLEELSIK